MAKTVGQVIERARRYLGVKDAHPRYTTPVLIDEFNTAIGDLREECMRLNEDWLGIEATLTMDASAPNRAVLADQTPAIPEIDRVLALRDDGIDGPARDEVPLADLRAYPGLTYALTGVPGALQIVLPEGNTPGTLWLRYVAPETEANDASDLMPAFVPDRFFDVVALKVAMQAFPFGGEERVPDDLLVALDRRTSMLWEAWSKRSSSLMRRRPRSEGQAPFTFM